MTGAKENKNKILKNISFVTTVYNEEEGIAVFLRSLIKQSKLPGEIVIVDGGSEDSTCEKILGFFRKMAKESKDKKLLISILDKSIEDNRKAGLKKAEIKNDLSDPGAIRVKIIKKKRVNISAGRNEAIKNASGEIICVGDAGCILDKNWLAEISRLYNNPLCDVVGGFNMPLCRNFVQKCLAACIMPLKEEIRSDRNMPSSRNISFRKQVWVDAGGYPENMDYGEDMKFNFNIKEAGYRIRFNPDAVVYWVMRENPVQIFRQFFRYARGDASGMMYPERHIIRFAAFLSVILVIFGIFYINVWIILILAALLIVYFYKPYKRLFRLFRNKNICYFNTKEKLLSILFVPFLLIQIDISKMCGYIYGLLKSIKDK
jgi:glycosyltransferase involved in cell wall biosynthesis